MPVQVLPGDAWLAPGFIDVQVNGGGDVLFNDTPTAEGIDAIAAAHRRFGTTGLLPTLISDTHDEDARRHRCGAERRGREPERARHPHRRAVPVARRSAACMTPRCSARPTRETSQLLTRGRRRACS